MKGNDIMFERTRIKYDENTGVRTVEKYNPIKERIGKLKNKASGALEFVSDNGELIAYGIGIGFVVWAIGLNNGVNWLNKAMIEGYKNDGYLGRADGLIFKRKMTFAEWMDYLDFCYNTKGGKRNKNINRYLREKGFID